LINQNSSIVHAIMIYVSTQRKNNNNDNDDLCKKKMLFHLDNFKININPKILKSMQCKHNNNIKATTLVMNIAIEKETSNSHCLNKVI
jgi:hypothetical protein